MQNALEQMKRLNFIHSKRMQIKTALRYHFHLSKWQKFKTLTRHTVGEPMRKYAIISKNI